MRRYSADEEERIRTEALVREWTRSGLLDPVQGAALVGELHVDVRRTNPFLRGGLALFTFVIIAASTGLAFSILGVRREAATSAALAVAAVACIAAAEYLIAAYRCYRFGVEEAFAVAAVVLSAWCGMAFASAMGLGTLWMPAVGLLIASAGALGLYARFGFIYAAIASMACAAALPFQFELPLSAQHAIAAAILAGAFVAARSKRREYGDDYPGDEYATLQAAAWAGVYLLLNLQISGGWPTPVRDWFYWATYVATWVLPAIGLWLGVRGRDRELMDLSIVMTLVTLATSKPYLGWTRNTWDPIVFGVVLIVLASTLRRWLASGTGGERAGFTAARILEKDRATLSHLGTVAALTQQGVAPASAPAPQGPDPFSGGRSGGGGGGAGF
jgi:hypothetical protein